MLGWMIRLCVMTEMLMMRMGKSAPGLTSQMLLEVLTILGGMLQENYL